MSSLQVPDETQAWWLDNKIGKLNRSFSSCSSYGTSTHCSRAAIAAECLFFPFFSSLSPLLPFLPKIGFIFVYPGPKLSAFVLWPSHCCDYRLWRLTFIGCWVLFPQHPMCRGCGGMGYSPWSISSHMSCSYKPLFFILIWYATCTLCWCTSSRKQPGLSWEAKIVY